MTLDTLKQNVASIWNNVAEGWRHLWASAAGALTRFTPGSQTRLPDRADVDDRFFGRGQAWAVLGGDVFEDEKRIVARLEVPGMAKEELQVDVVNDQVVISGEKRFEEEQTLGRWRVVQCAYGSFLRAIPLPCAVKADAATASYKNGVLRVELPKLNPGRPLTKTIRVQ
jgi:HSP20 family protein